MSNLLVIYHANCTDGFGAAWCFWNKYKTQATYLPAKYNDPAPDVTGKNVYLVDFSYPPAEVERMLATAESVTLIDHHKTAIDALSHLRFAPPDGSRKALGWFCDTKRSGAVLAWLLLNSIASPPTLLGHIQDRDLWQFKLPGTKDVIAGLQSHAFDFEVWDTLMLSGPAAVLGLSANGAAILRKHDKDLRSLLDASTRHMVIGGYAVLCANVPPFMASDAGHMLSAGEQFAATYYDSPSGRVFSLRSAPEGVDVSEIARQYGGGGHAHAAGFTAPRDHDLAKA